MTSQPRNLDSMILQLAWRNIWRNKRRTILTIGAVAFGVFFSTFMDSFQRGTWDSIIDGAVNQYFGYAQIHNDGYWDDQVIDNSMVFGKELIALPEKISTLKEVVPRMESFALASAGELTAGAFVIGIDPDKENRLTKIKEKIVEGTYLTATDNAVNIASGLAEKLGLGINDTIILISQGYHGVNAAGKYPIKGIFKLGLPDLNKSLLYLPLAKAQALYGAEGRVTTLVLKIDNRKEVQQTIVAVNQHLSNKEQYEIMSWKELMPELVEARQLKEGGGYVVIGILYLLIGFMLFGTILMMVKERSYEFGVLTAIGMKRWKLFSIVWLETITLAIFGSIIGILMSMPLVYYLKVNPINVADIGKEAAVAYEKFGLQGDLPAAFEYSIFFQQAFIIFIITSLLALFPWLIIRKLKPVEAMRN